MTEAEIERACVEAVFRLGGGELSDTPWEASYTTERGKDAGESGYIVKFPHWYEGIPEWAADEVLGTTKWDSRRDRHSVEGATYRTLIPAADPYSGPPEELRDENGTWKLLRTFTSSGETECVYRGGDEGDMVMLRHVDKRGLCPYCEEEYRKPHGYIYLGDGACEAVYRLVEAEGSESDG